MRNPLRIIGNRVMKIMGDPRIAKLEEEGMRDKVMLYSAYKKQINNKGTAYKRLAAKNELSEVEAKEKDMILGQLKTDMTNFSGGNWDKVKTKTDDAGRMHFTLPVYQRSADMSPEQYHATTAMLQDHFRNKFTPLEKAHKQELLYGATTAGAAVGGAGALGLVALAAMRKKKQIAETASRSKRMLGVGAGLGLGGAALYGYNNR